MAKYKKLYQDLVRDNYGLNTNFMVLPSKIYAVVGFQLCIYKNAIIRNPDTSSYYTLEVYNTTLGSYIKNLDRFIQFELLAEHVGEHDLVFKLYNLAGQKIQEKTVTIECLTSTGLSSSKGIVMVGDSLTDGGTGFPDWITKTTREDFVTLGGTTPTMLGTNGITPNENEGIAGWSYTLFDGETSPFWSGSAIDFSWYSANQIGGVTIDLLSFQLGVNDMYNGKTEAEQIEALNHCKNLVDAYLTYNSSGKVVIIMPTVGMDSNAWGNDYKAAYNRNDYYNSIFEFKQLLIDTFDNGAYNSNVVVSIGTYSLDTIYGTLTETKAVNSRISETILVQENALHPKDKGYELIADGIFPILLNELR